MKLNILVVEDELIVAANIRSVLESAGHRILGMCRSVQQAISHLEDTRPDLVLLDIFLQGNHTGIDLALVLNEKHIPFVYISANSNQEVLEAAKATGPYGFIVKPFREKDLLVSIDIAWYRHEYNQQSQPLPYRNSTNPAIGIAADHGILGRSPALQTAIELARQVAAVETSVLLLGASGTGKENLARFIHRFSNRHARSFVVVNCAALPAHLIESELFGHEKGAFTDAHEKKIGKFELADDGTLFLDEIGEMPVDLQVKLLRVLQEKEIERIGGSQAIRVDVRIIAATNRNLEKEIAEGRFRPDLYYRLHVFPIQLPELKDRREDIPLLAEHFVRLYAARLEKPVTGIAPPVIKQLMEYSWPGNIRELQNWMERAVVLADSDTIDELGLPGPATTTSIAPGLPRTLEQMEREHILQVLRYCNFKLSGNGGAAEVLGLSVGVLSAKMKKLGIVKTHE